MCARSLACHCCEENLLLQADSMVDLMRTCDMDQSMAQVVTRSAWLCSSLFSIQFRHRCSLCSRNRSSSSIPPTWSFDKGERHQQRHCGLQLSCQTHFPDCDAGCNLGLVTVSKVFTLQMVKYRHDCAAWEGCRWAIRRPSSCHGASS